MWNHTVSYLMAVEEMKISEEKMRNVLKFYGYKAPSLEMIGKYRNEPRQFMILPEFVATFANGTLAPWVKGKEADEFGKQFLSKIKQWIQDRTD